MHQDHTTEDMNTYHVVVAKDDHRRLKAKAALAERNLRETYAEVLETLLSQTSGKGNLAIPRHQLPRPIKNHTCRVNLYLPADTWAALQQLREQTGVRNLDLVHAAVALAG